MIISKDTNPENDLYYIGSKIIESLEDITDISIPFMELLVSVRSKIALSSNLYTLALDWLYIIGAIDLTMTGDIKKCF
jgi:hypothetical protein